MTGTSVGVDVTLNSSYKFVETGSHDRFGFDLKNGLPTATLSNFTTGFVASSGFSNGFESSFAYSVACPGCNSGGSSRLAGPRDLTVSLASGTVSVTDFVANAELYTFAADVIGPNSTGATFTGLVESNGTASSVPEPVSLSLVRGGCLPWASSANALIPRGRQPARHQVRGEGSPLEFPPRPSGIGEENRSRQMKRRPG
jgi:hypothetical protein